MPAWTSWRPRSAPARRRRHDRATTMKAAFSLGLKLAVTVGLLWWLLDGIDSSAVAGRLTAIGPLAVLVALLLLAAHLPAIAARWGVICHAVGHPLRLGTLVRLTYVGVFFNQVLPAPVGGDAMRVWGARRAGLPLGKATAGVVLERLWGLGTLVLFAAPVWPFLLDGDSPRLALAVGSTLVAVTATVAAMWVLRRAPAALARRLPGSIGRFLDDARETAWPPDRVLLLLLWSLSGHIAAVACVAALAGAMRIPVGPLEILVVVPIVLLAAVVPLSFAGWGVREGAMVAALARFEVPAADALALSIGFGLVLLLLSLPGAALFLVGAGDDQSKSNEPR